MRIEGPQPADTDGKLRNEVNQHAFPLFSILL